MINKQQTINNQYNNHQFDLEERTARFAESIISLVRSIKITPYNKRIIEQVVGSGGSTGANYCEASEAESKKDFQHKISICKKEIKETKHWLRLLSRTNPEKVEGIRIIWSEARELLLIFSKSLSSSKKER